MDSQRNNITDRLRRGDRGAFRELYWEHQRSVYGLALRYLKDPSLAEDAVQDVFLKLWQQRGSLDCEKSLAAFLYTTLKHHVLNTIKSRQRRVQRNYIWSSSNESKSRLPDEQLHYRDCREALQEGVERLPEQKRLIYELKTVHGYSNDEIALRLGISVHTVKSQYYRASRYIREFVASRAN